MIITQFKTFNKSHYQSLLQFFKIPVRNRQCKNNMEHQEHEKCRNNWKKKNFHAICGLRAVSSISRFSSAHHFSHYLARLTSTARHVRIVDLLSFTLRFLLRHSTTWIFLLLKFRDIYDSTKTCEMKWSQKQLQAINRGHAQRNRNQMVCFANFTSKHNEAACKKRKHSGKICKVMRNYILLFYSNYKSY